MAAAINGCYDSPTVEVHRQNRRMRLHERSLARAVRVAAGVEFLGEGTRERAGHRDLHPLVPRNRVDRGWRGIPHLRSSGARSGFPAGGAL